MWQRSIQSSLRALPFPNMFYGLFPRWTWNKSHRFGKYCMCCISFPHRTFIKSSCLPDWAVFDKETVSQCVYSCVCSLEVKTSVKTRGRAAVYHFWFLYFQPVGLYNRLRSVTHKHLHALLTPFDLVRKDLLCSLWFFCPQTWFSRLNTHTISRITPSQPLLLFSAAMH